MRVEISKNIKIWEPSNEILGWIGNNMVLNNPVYIQLKIMGKEDTIRRNHVPEKLNLYTDSRGVITLPFGTLYAIWNFIKDCEIKTNFNDSGDISIKDDKPTFELFDYQEEAVQNMVKAKGGVLVAPCSAGKTFCGIEIMRRIGKKALWICHTGDLLRQAKEDILIQYPNAKIGLTTEGKVEIGDDITVSTVQTLDKIDKSLYENEFDVVLIDECHHCVSSPTQMKMFGRVLSNINARYKYGFTATVKRGDGMTNSMFSYIGMSRNGNFEATYEIPKDAIKKIPAIHEKFELYSGYDFEKLNILYDSAGMMNYNRLIQTLTEDNTRTEKILQNIKKCDDEGRKQVVLSHRVEHCIEIVEKLNNMGIDAVLCTGKVPNKKRKAILKQEIDWNVQVATYSLLKEGISIKELDTLHMITPFRDEGMAIQCVGRIERFLENKKQPIAYDYVDIDIPYCVKRFADRKRALKKR